MSDVTIELRLSEATGDRVKAVDCQLEYRNWSGQPVWSVSYSGEIVLYDAGGTPIVHGTVADSEALRCSIEQGETRL